MFRTLLILLCPLLLFSNENTMQKAFVKADISWCENLDCNSIPYAPIGHPKKDECKLNTRESYIEAISDIFVVDGDFPHGNEWQIGIYGPELEEKIPGRSDNYFIFINKWQQDDDSNSYSVSWNSVNRGMKGNWPLGEDFKFQQGWPQGGKVKGTKRYTFTNDCVEIVIDYYIADIIEKINYKKELKYSDLAEYLSLGYTNMDYILDLSYIAKAFDDKIDELLEARIAENERTQKWAEDEGWNLPSTNYRDLNKIILETQKAWQKYAGSCFDEEYWGGGSGASARGSSRYIQKQIERINELKVILK